MGCKSTVITLGMFATASTGSSISAIILYYE